MNKQGQIFANKWQINRTTMMYEVCTQVISSVFLESTRKKEVD